MVNNCPVTALILAGNEINNIERCINSVHWADEILVVDDYSEDGTAAKAGELGAKVVQREYDYYGAQSQWGMQQASHEWIFQIDADEECTPELAEEIEKLFNQQPEYDAYSMFIRPVFLGKEIRHGSWGGKKRIRLYKKTGVYYEGPKNHESLQNIKSVGQLHGAYFHHTYSSMHEWVKKQIWYARFGCETVYEKGHKPGVINLLFRPPLRFLNSYIRRLGFLDGKRGLMIAGFEAITIFLRNCYLYELNNQKNPSQYRPSQWKE